MLDKYINELRGKINRLEATAEERDLFAYAQSYKKGEVALRAYRDRLVAREINAIVDKDAQIAILFNKDTEPEEYAAYQDLRKACKAKADGKMVRLKAELEMELAKI